MVEVRNIITVGILHRHKLFIEGLKQLIHPHSSIQVIAQGTSKDELIHIIKNRNPNIILLDSSLLELQDLFKVKYLLKKYPNTNIILISNNGFNIEYIIAAIDSGIHGFLLKDLSYQILIEVIRTVSKGDFWLHPQACRCLISKFKDLKEKIEKSKCKHIRDERPNNLLSEREWEVLELIANGENNQIIAKNLGITETTVKAHVSHILKKLKVDSRMNAVLLAIKNGWIDINKELNTN